MDILSDFKLNISRDGVSEGQFYQVLLFELDAIRKVLTILSFPFSAFVLLPAENLKCHIKSIMHICPLLNEVLCRLVPLWSQITNHQSRLL